MYPCRFNRSLLAVINSTQNRSSKLRDPEDQNPSTNSGRLLILALQAISTSPVPIPKYVGAFLGLRGQYLKLGADCSTLHRMHRSGPTNTSGRGRSRILRALQRMKLCNQKAGVISPPLLAAWYYRERGEWISVIPAVTRAM